jgi:hypothetical protein
VSERFESFYSFIDGSQQAALFGSGEETVHELTGAVEVKLTLGDICSYVSQHGMGSAAM